MKAAVTFCLELLAAVLAGTLGGLLVAIFWDDEGNFREWISALSGWAAAVAAVATILVMRAIHNKQALARLDDQARCLKIACDRVEAIRRAQADLMGVFKFLESENSVELGGLLLLKGRIQGIVDFLDHESLRQGEAVCGALIVQAGMSVAEYAARRAATIALDYTYIVEKDDKFLLIGEHRRSLLTTTQGALEAINTFVEAFDVNAKCWTDEYKRTLEKHDNFTIKRTDMLRAKHTAPA